MAEDETIVVDDRLVRAENCIREFAEFPDDDRLSVSLAARFILQVIDAVQKQYDE